MNHFITEMEEAEEILKIKYNQYGVSAQDKKLMESLLIFLKERQCISNAALSVEDSYEALVQEREELEERERAIFQALSSRMNSSLMQHRIVLMEYYNQLTRACRQFQRLLGKVVKYKTITKGELDSLNQRLENFNGKLESIGTGGAESFKVPKKQMTKVTKSTEEAFSRIDVTNKFLRSLQAKLEVVEDILKHPHQLEELAHSMSPANSSSSSSPELSAEGANTDSEEELLCEMDGN